MYVYDGNVMAVVVMMTKMMMMMQGSCTADLPSGHVKRREAKAGGKGCRGMQGG